MHCPVNIPSSSGYLSFIASISMASLQSLISSNIHSQYVPVYFLSKHVHLGEKTSVNLFLSLTWISNRCSSDSNKDLITFTLVRMKTIEENCRLTDTMIHLVFLSFVALFNRVNNWFPSSRRATQEVVRWRIKKYEATPMQQRQAATHTVGVKVIR